ncbi:hypothetical protein [Streptomyces sp. NBC_00365]|uniref:hypothetical protein n=1 Tax=Streptomyces sp. NBC_00365 TaxID=2975726 RepID=UPI00225C3CD5|nr:hypothetical protein [Streptomyces sp. NBC_00365]
MLASAPHDRTAAFTAAGFPVAVISEPSPASGAGESFFTTQSGSVLAFQFFIR